jgi:ornithine cyclodeaminase
LIGSFTPAMRESDDACAGVSTVFVDTQEAVMKSGDLLSPLASGVLCQEAIAADLATLCRGQHPGRTRDDEITLFKSVGTALEDLAAASLAYDARRAGAALNRAERPSP